MTTAPPPPAPKAKPAAPPPPQQQSQAKTETKRSYAVKSGVQQTPMRVVLYGAGGVGKSKLVSLAQMLGLRVLMIDLEQGTHHLDVDRIDDIEGWAELRGLLQDTSFTDQYDLIGVDSFTKAEDMSAAWVPYNVKNVKTGKLPEAKSLSGYGFGDGLTYNYDNFLAMLGDLDALVRRGKHVVGIAHDAVANAPNPQGEDFIRYEPRLQSPSGGKNSIRHKIKEWADHLLYIGYDISASDRKAEGSGTRTIYTRELPAYWAKSRTLQDNIPYIDNDPTLWKMLLNKE